MGTAPKKKRRRRCQSIAKSTGRRCDANPLRKGTVIEGVTVSGKHCRRHDPELPGSARFGSKEQAGAAAKLGGRPRKPRVVDVMRERVEERIEEILAPYFDQLTGAVVTAKFQGEVYPSTHPDLAARLEAAERLLDRVYGKPVQTTEVSGLDGGPIQVNEDAFADPKTREALDELVGRLGAARESGPSRSGSGD